MSVRMFNTHHAPVGALSSLTFGAPGVGVSIDFCEPSLKKSGTMFVGKAGKNALRTILFADMPKEKGYDVTDEGDKEHTQKKNDPLAIYNAAQEDEITRILTLSKDTLSVDNFTFTTYTPYPALPDPAVSEIKAADCIPGILMDISIDNSNSSEPCTLFFGLQYINPKQVFAFDRGNVKSIRYRNNWEFAAKDEDVYIIRGLDAPERLMRGKSFIQQLGPAFLCKNVAAGEKTVLTVSWSVYGCDACNGTINARYYYNRFFSGLDEVTESILERAQSVREIAKAVDEEFLSNKTNKPRSEIFCQSVRSYYASSQLMEAEDGSIHWNIGEGAYTWRNTMDLCVEHIGWELRRNPWIVRSIMDDFLNLYSYYDKVTFADRKGEFEGGLAFTHDMGSGFTYSLKGYSGYECPQSKPCGCYYYMTTEELLNGIYCIAGYLLTTKDVGWLNHHNTLIGDLLSSLENRDSPEASARDGILKGVSTRSGGCGFESTTYDALDHSLLVASGNLYIFIKTWCSLILLQSCARLIDDKASEERVKIMLAKCRFSAERFRSASLPWLSANVYMDLESAVAAAVEPLGIPKWLGVLSEEDEPLLVSMMREHISACIVKGVCIDSVSGGLRLSSTSRNTWLSKVMLVIYVMENVLGVEVPSDMENRLIDWCQISCKDCTISDQLFCDTQEIIGGPYYPRMAISAICM